MLHIGRNSSSLVEQHARTVGNLSEEFSRLFRGETFDFSSILFPFGSGDVGNFGSSVRSIKDSALFDFVHRSSEIRRIPPERERPNLIDDDARRFGTKKFLLRLKICRFFSGEKIPFFKEFFAKGQVEEWLNEFLGIHKMTIHHLIRKSVEKIQSDSTDFYKFVDEEIAQLSLLIVQIIWTQRCERALKESNVKKSIMNETNKYLTEILNNFIEKTTRSDFHENKMKNWTNENICRNF